MREELLAHVANQRGQANPLRNRLGKGELAGDPLGQPVDVGARLDTVAQRAELAALGAAGIAYEHEAQEVETAVERSGGGVCSLVHAQGMARFSAPTIGNLRGMAAQLSAYWAPAT